MRQPGRPAVLSALFGIGLQGCTYTMVVPVSVTPDGGPGNRQSLNPTVSNDGRYVTFESEATDLVAGVTIPDIVGQFRNRQVYVRDLGTGATEIVSLDVAGRPVAGRAFNPSISADGRYVTFETAARGVVDPSIPPEITHVYVRDRERRETALVSTRTGGRPFSRGGHGGVITPNGRLVFFTSRYFRSDDHPETIFRRDLANARTEELRVAPDGRLVFGEDEIGAPPGVEGTVGASDTLGGWVTFVSRQRLPSVDRQGSIVAWPAGYYDHDVVYLLGRNGGAYVASAGQVLAPVAASCCPAGRFGPRVAFESDSHVLLGDGEDTNDLTDIFRFDQNAYNGPAAGAFVVRVSAASDGSDPDGESHRPSTIDGNLVAFDSGATNLVEDDTNGRTDVFLRNVREGTTEVVSRAGRNGRTVADGRSQNPSISEDAKVIAFVSSARNFTDPWPTRADWQVFVRKRFLCFLRCPSR